ncbi:uncharacterized protein FTOL_11933 [Fusarium torulosum]|uniref:Ketoreductase domain-containing protein n=1 Tax=Fusarium torulosum TaxID=33205 RepID=A0AAE8MLB5_9HYPO|nr:uncharacterized protein FTOL_11933 [Fusarium torulosum]
MIEENILERTHLLVAAGLSQLQNVILRGFTSPLAWVVPSSIDPGAYQTNELTASPLLGLIRTATSEHEALRLRFVHLVIGDDEAIKSLVTCLLPPSAETECAIRYCEVFVPRLGYTSCQAPTPPSPLIRAGESILITGATGGIGSRIARWLVDAYGIRGLVLMSCRGENAPGGKALIAELAERGVEATVVAADVSELESLSSVLSLFGNDRPLRGVIHTAAVLDDGVLSSLTAGRCDNVIKFKVDGAWNLHLLTKDLDLDLFLLFSSVLGILGTTGQANYAAANTFVDALAHWRRTNDMPAFSVAWGPWSGEGMVGKLDEGLKRRMSQQGVNLLGTEDGLALLQETISGNRPLSVAVSFDFSKIGKYFGSQAHVPQLFRSLLPD